MLNFKSFQTFFKKRSIFDSNLRVVINSKYQKLYKKNNINLCYNKFIPKDYNPDKNNILLAFESPAVIEYEKWIKPEMKFIAEISFNNYKNLNNYYCCRDLYANSDSFLSIKLGTKFLNKYKLVSFVYSYKNYLEGHKFRHKIAQEFKDKLDLYGSGYNKFVRIINTLKDYMFQVVIENGKYPEFVSDKFYDCIKTQTIPIYWGGEDGVRKMGFDLKGIIFFDNIEELSTIINNLNPELYKDMYKATIFNLNRLIEIRNEKKMNHYLHTIILNYMQTTDSYLGFGYNKINLLLD